jgi:hypothetical protein
MINKILKNTSLILTFCLLFQSVQTSAVPLLGTYRFKQPKLYLCMGQLNSSARSFRTNNNIPDVKLVGASSIDPDDNLTVHEDMLRRQIAALFPNANNTGIGVLDWEGKGMEILAIGPTNSQDFVSVLNKFKKVITISKQMRPNVKWGFYALPFRNYWNLDEAWRKRCLKLTPLLEMCDFIAPSLYNLYPDSLYAKGNERYVHENMQMALRLSSIVHKEVYPFIWHRLPGNVLMKKEEFTRQARQILKERYAQTRVHALIWYGEEVYGFNIKNKRILDEIGPRNDLAPYLTQLIQNYGSSLLYLFG